MKENEISIHKPFGPVIAEFKISEKTINYLNTFVDSLEKDSELRKKLDYGPMLAGQVSEEIGVPMEVAKKSIGPELATAITNYIYQSTGKKITKCNFIKIWIVRQFGTEYNPVHFHSGHLSGAGWLKVPSTFGKSIQKDKIHNFNGAIQFVHGSRMFNSKSTFTITPKVGLMFLFPAYLMHQVYPFYSDEERRSIAFNANIDEDIYNVYGQKAKG